MSEVTPKMSESTHHHAGHKEGQDPSSIYALSFALLVGFALLAGSVWFSANSIADSVAELDSTLLAKELSVNVQGGSAAPSPSPSPTPAVPSAKTVDISSRAIKGDGELTIVEFSEFQCPYCTRAQPTIAQLMVDYDGKIQIAHMNYIVHESAKPASVAVECAGDQDKYFEMHDKIFETQKTGLAGLTEVAESIGLNMDDYNSCISAGKDKTLAVQQSAGRSIGVGGTPSFLIGFVKDGKVTGELIVGAQPIENFKAIIDKQMGS